ncbi:hypothetical protein B0I35DRAFT_424159 [Stachybotrys elegans]|uniref:C2H2-type domain-containing protein n=1 Tax=Stachybotrys elegans TaxID=80388 RepID=A0A8K0T1J2_9HYPO|nr:hypothetical protein B0I35DRAFT_424159 [Stachybotrys elegans]
MQQNIHAMHGKEAHRNAGYRCSLCNKAFAAESTYKRHGYYCRSKLGRPSVPRQKSCAACVRAKARCAWLCTAYCVRCNERGLECERDGAQQVWNVSSAEAPALGSIDLAADLDSASVSLGLLADIDSASSTSTSPPAAWTAVHDLLHTLTLGSSERFRDYEDPVVQGCPYLVEMIQPTTSVAFAPRTGAGNAQVLSSILIRILQSYPLMLLRRETFPPFVSPLLYSWAETGQTPPQHPLVNCVSLVHMFKAEAEPNKMFVWSVIKLEQERILLEHPSWDRWGMLSSIQALVVYCLLRLSDQSGRKELDGPLLLTLNVVSRALAASLGDNHTANFSNDVKLAWQDWVFNESLRRTLLVMRILDMVVDISEGLACNPVPGFAIMPLPSNATVWGAQSLELWQAEFSVCYEERIIYGLSETGQLTKLQQTPTGVQTSIAKWEDWNAAAGELASIVMIAGTLLESKNSFPCVGDSESSQTMYT